MKDYDYFNYEELNCLSKNKIDKVSLIRAKNDEFYFYYLANYSTTNAIYYSKQIDKWDVLRYFKRKMPRFLKFILRPLYKKIRKIIKI